MNEKSSFARLSGVNVNDHVEKKGQFSYLSWPYAVAQLRLADPTATWEVKRFDGLPFLRTENGYFVEVAVTVEGVTLSQIHPVLDSKNRPIPEPTVFDLNTSLQRCLVKAIALHGLGLYIYAGEDLPNPSNTLEDQSTPPKEQPVPIHGQKASAAQIRYIEGLIRDTGSDLAKVLDYFGVEALADLTSPMASRVIKSLEKSRRAA
ncbi:MAG: DUF1071 domain-containing protein [Phycisphaeraceae bacterium]|nr:DUF1071 domain-containing protein [Phycisphaeraceae bacterium]